MLQYEIINHPDPLTGEVADIVFDTFEYERMLGKLVLDASVDRDLTVATFPCALVERAKAKINRIDERFDKVDNFFKRNHMGFVVHPRHEGDPLDSLRSSKRYPDTIHVRVDSNDDEFNNLALAAQTYLWSVEANSLPSSQSWHNRLMMSRLLAPLLCGTATGYGVAEMLPLPVSGKALYGVFAGSLAMYGGLSAMGKLASSRDPDFDHAKTFAREYFQNNAPIIQTLGPPRLQEVSE